MFIASRMYNNLINVFQTKSKCQMRPKKKEFVGDLKSHEIHGTSCKYPVMWWIQCPLSGYHCCMLLFGFSGGSFCIIHALCDTIYHRESPFGIKLNEFFPWSVEPKGPQGKESVLRPPPSHSGFLN